jgi:pyridoxamine 5'-phosphate oxidase
MAAADDPFALFEAWLNEAREKEPNDPEAMAFATADAEGRPSVRMVLLRRHGPDGFGFFTNLDSRKGRELAENPHGALAIHWKSLRRQVRAEGRVEQVSDAEADSYFAGRSRESQVGSWASDQSRPLESRELFERRYQEMQSKFEGRPVARPPRWSGFRLIPDRIEFWTDRPHRLHERRLFTRAGDGWTEGLLYP